MQSICTQESCSINTENSFTTRDLPINNILQNGGLNEDMKGERAEFMPEAGEETPPHIPQQAGLAKTENLLVDVKVEKEEIMQESFEDTPPALVEYSVEKVGVSDRHNDIRKLCEQCSFKTGCKRAYEQPFQTQFSDGKLFECELCSVRYAYKSINTLEKPLKRNKQSLNTPLTTHTGKISFKCDHCSFNCARKRYLVAHLKTHSEEKPFQCDHCLFRSAHKRSLIVHLKLHTGEKPFECDQCSYTSAHKGNYSVHLNTHTGMKPFKCHQCSFTSALKGNYKVHLRKHTGVKPFQCDHCSFRSARKENLIAHAKKHNPIGQMPFK